MKKALITGAAGFIGSHLVDDLLSHNWDITAVDNFDPFYAPAAKWLNVMPHLLGSHYRLVEADIRDLSLLRERLTGDYDVIVHLAAKAGVRPSIEDPIGYQEINVRGTHNLLELAREWKTPQFVFGSSSSVYGVNPNVPWKEEDKVLLPISPYASTKVSCELLGHVYSHLFGIRFVGLRFFTVFGPRQRPDLAIHKFATLMQSGQAIPVFGSGDTSRDYTYVSDITQGIRAAMTYVNSPYELFNLGGSNPVNLLQLIHLLADVLHAKPHLKFLPPQPGDVSQTWACIAKAGRQLGYQPRTPIGDGLRLFANWLGDSDINAAAGSSAIASHSVHA
jgi:UDP-glucuronate 4-epimerase